MKLRIWVIAIGIFLAGVGIALWWASSRIEPLAEEKLLTYLRERYGSDVELRKVRLKLWPKLSVTGEDLTLFFKGRRDIKPLATVKRFVVTTDWTAVRETPVRIRNVRLEGLRITVPPRKSDAEGKAKRAEAAPADSSSPASRAVVSEIVADGATLEMTPKKAGKEPLFFDISKLKLKSVGVGLPLEFDAVLTNPRPPGLIRSQGKFGPWNSEDPSHTPVSGQYTFDKADLSVFNGIAGILSSTGKYEGTLDHIEVHGETRTPDFEVKGAGYPVNLTTQFDAVVDGTDGDTYLDPVRAKFLNSTLICVGSVAKKQDGEGKTVTLDVNSAGARIEDMLRLAVRAPKPFLRGQLNLVTKLEIPPGKVPVIDKLKLDGRFGLTGTTFTSESVQAKVEEFSKRSRGVFRKEGGEDVAVLSDLKGAFRLGGGTLALPRLTFSVPGANVGLNGTYAIRSGEMDFDGLVRMDATLSRIVGGWKGMLLKVADPFFKKDGAGTELPIKISGTREAPKFGLNLRNRDKKN